MVALEALRIEAPGTRAIWVCRADAEDPIATLENDKLPQRRELAVRANAIARRSSNGFTYLPGRHVQAVRKNGKGFQLSVRSRRGGVEEIECGAIIANVGYHPDERIYRQLQVHECYATLGPIDLAASLLGQETADCLAIQTAGAEVLKTPEPNFFILGAKSFGTNSAFLMRLGHEQIVQLFTLIMQEPALNLYEP
ncbi:hypothetical protein IIC65_07465 [Candidatus Sumerlaeota bacterium]|nr:hypothetical protein [Candidatus Sumerlaeota bacterium]